MPEGRFIGACCRCKSDMWLPLVLYESARHSSKIVFFCPYGHEQIFSDKESEEDKLRRERDRLQQKLAEKDDELKAQIASAKAFKAQAAAYKASATKARQRGSKGVCLACNRQFQNVARHMHTKHPTFKAEEIINGKLAS
jgi:N-acetylmuramic acid 6-phosphate (MurNAc-6-P) etherase